LEAASLTSLPPALIDLAIVGSRASVLDVAYIADNEEMESGERETIKMFVSDDEENQQHTRTYTHTPIYPMGTYMK
jgi:hypothetical protein